MQISKVDVSLSQGQLLGRKHWIALWLFMMAPCLLELMAIIIVFISMFNPKFEFDNTIIFVIVFINILFLLLISIAAYIIIKNGKLKKNVYLWMADAIETKAYSKKIGENRLGIQPTAVKIQVKFEIDKKNLCKG